VIVLRIRLDGVTLDHRLERGDATLGSGSRSTIRATNAGWPSLAATLRQDGTEVRMIVPGRVGTVTLRVGDEIRLGRADVSVVGLLPPEDEALPSAEAFHATVASALPPAGRTSAPAVSANPPSPAAPPRGPLPAFGDYADAASPRFALDEPPRAPASVGDLPPPRPPPRAPVEAFASKSAAPPAASAAPATSSPAAATPTPALPAPTSSPGASAPAGAKPTAVSRAEVASTWDGPQQDFGTEMFAQIKRTPWFAVSVAFHLLLFLIFRLSVTQAQPLPPRWGGGTLAGSLLPQQSVDREALQPQVQEELEVLPATPPPADPFLPPEDPTEVRADPHPMPVDLQLEEELPSDLGTQPTLSAAGRRTSPRSVPAKAPPREDLRQEFVKENMRDARQRAAKHVRDALGVDRGGPGEALKQLAAEEVLVVTGEFDHQENVLRDLGIPHTLISPYDPRLMKGEAFDQPRFVFWNCGAAVNARYASRLGVRVKAFVDGGGFLFTSDWALDNVLKPSFPGYVEPGSGPDLPKMVLDIAPTTAGVGHALLEGVFQPGLVGRWWLEQQSHEIVIKKPREVTVLIEGPALRDLHGRSPAMAITFSSGKGRVLHVMGHYDQEEGNIAGTVAVQRIALNFVLMGLGAIQEKPK
jgi:hypothetical protein